MTDKPRSKSEMRRLAVQTEPLPCPFCGMDPGVAHRLTTTSEGYVVACEYIGCSVTVVSHQHPTVEDAINAWNRRSHG